MLFELTWIVQLPLVYMYYICIFTVYDYSRKVQPKCMESNKPHFVPKPCHIQCVITHSYIVFGWRWKKLLTHSPLTQLAGYVYFMPCDNGLVVIGEWLSYYMCGSYALSANFPVYFVLCPEKGIVCLGAMFYFIHME